LNPATGAVPAAGGTTQTTVTDCDAGWNASVTAGTDWLSVSPEAGKIDDVLQATATANTSTKARSGIVTFRDGAGETATFTVTQAAISATDDHGNTPETATDWIVYSDVQPPPPTGVLETGPDVDVFRLITSSPLIYTFTSQTTSGDVYGSLVDASGRVIAEDDNSGGGGDFKITHRFARDDVYYLVVSNSSSSYASPVPYSLGASYETPELNLNPVTGSIPAGGGTTQTTVTSCFFGWDAAVTAGTDWLSVSPGSGEIGDVLQVTATANTSTGERTGIVTFSDGNGIGGRTTTFTVYQAGAKD
jgi:hypothetical protein